jgi:hypothetical protein
MTGNQKLADSSPEFSGEKSFVKKTNHLLKMTREILHIAALLNQRNGTLTKRHWIMIPGLDLFQYSKHVFHCNSR